MTPPSPPNSTIRRRGGDEAGPAVDAANETGTTLLSESAGMRVAHRYAVHQEERWPGLDPANLQQSNRPGEPTNVA